MSIMSRIFGHATNPGVNPGNVDPATLAAAGVPPANPTGYNPGTAMQTKSDATTAPNGTVPASATGMDDPSKSGLDQFNDLWNTDPKANQGQGQPLFNVSPEQIQAAARKQNFTKDAATAEQLAKVAAGGQEAVQAMLEIMNTVTQNVYAQNATATTKLIEGALDKSGFAKASDLETHFKKHSLTNTLHEVNPVFASPAAAPIVEGLKVQFLQKYPAATPSELQGLITDYLTKFTSEFKKPEVSAQAAKVAKAAEADDWSRFLE